jgi:hypothetical protein
VGGRKGRGGVGQKGEGGRSVVLVLGYIVCAVVIGEGGGQL